MGLGLASWCGAKHYNTLEKDKLIRIVNLRSCYKKTK